jgi:hypothetical protein
VGISRNRPAKNRYRYLSDSRETYVLSSNPYLILKALEDNSVKDVSDILAKMGKNEPSHEKDGEEQPMKVSHKNGSKH